MTIQNILQFKNITYSIVNEDNNIVDEYVIILSNLNGKFKSGTITALMGEGGCDKTYLFEILVDNILEFSKTSGHVLYNGEERYWDSWTKKSFYLSQDDVYYPKISIYETHMYYLSLDTKKSNREKRVK